METMKNCRLCPRKCGADRAAGQKGICRAGEPLRVARAALHFWEEPCISGTGGSGTVFFSGCPLHCVFCQNGEISGGQAGAEIPPERLVRIFWELAEKGAHNINLVTPTHYAPQIAQAIRTAKKEGFGLPFVYNCGGYEGDALSYVDGLIGVYLTDFKYFDPGIAGRYSGAADYPAEAKKSLAEMARRAGEPRFDKDGMMLRGVIVRVLLLPGCLDDAKNVVRYVYETYGGGVYLSLMSQYTPVHPERLPAELARSVKPEEYGALVEYAVDLGVENGFLQEGEAASESFIPPFDLTGVLHP